MQRECADLQVAPRGSRGHARRDPQGDVDALVVGDDIYTLDSANAATNRLRQDVLAQMEDAVLAFDADDHLIFMNPAAERQYGAAASDDAGPPEQRAVHARAGPTATERAARLDGSRAHGRVPRATRSTARPTACETARRDDGLAPARRARATTIGTSTSSATSANASRPSEALRAADAALAPPRAPVLDAGGELARHLRALRPRAAAISTSARSSSATPASTRRPFIGKTNAELGMSGALCAAVDDALGDSVRHRRGRPRQVRASRTPRRRRRACSTRA